MGKKKKDDDTNSIHVDLVIKILSRLPVRALMRLKCLSKEFSGIIQSRYFGNLCLSCSSYRPRLLFCFHCHEDKKLVFFSAPHGWTCSKAPTRYEMTVCGGVGVSLRSPPVRGLIIYTIRPNQHVICNPSTRQQLSLPENKVLGKHDDLIEFLIFGYDPIFDQFKVLCMSGLGVPSQNQFWVYTVGQDGDLWRKIQGIPNHLNPVTYNSVCGESGICINGVLYFKAYPRTPGDLVTCEVSLVSFDLNSEIFRLIETSCHLSWFSKLIEFQGKLGFISRVKKGCEIELSCLMENKEWSLMVFPLPWAQVNKSQYRTIPSSVLGICDGEIVFVSPTIQVPGYTWHLSLQKKTVRKVEFETPSTGSYGRFSAYYFANHVETTVSLL